MVEADGHQVGIVEPSLAEVRKTPGPHAVPERVELVQVPAENLFSFRKLQAAGVLPVLVERIQVGEEGHEEGGKKHFIGDRIPRFLSRGVGRTEGFLDEEEGAPFPDELRQALRQDPDIILVGEMRDFETIQTSLVAAETGHLVLSTLHTIDSTETINRIIAVFPPYQHTQVRMQLSSVLNIILWEGWMVFFSIQKSTCGPS